MKLLKIWRDPEERKAYAYILSLTLPIVIQSLFNVAVNSVDVLMLNSVGQASISAVSLANQYSMVLNQVFSGIGSGVAILAAQYWGKKDIPTIERVQGIALRLMSIASLAFSLVSVAVPTAMMRVYTTDPELISIGAVYLRILGMSHIFWGIGETCFSTLRSIERVKTCTYVNILTLLLNVFLNAVFIYGWFGLPRMGAAGVALATAISRFAQFIAAVVISRTPGAVKLSVSSALRIDRTLFRDFVRVSLPVLVNTVAWSVGFSLYSAILGHISSDLVAANSIVSVVRSFGTVLCWSIATAVVIFVGKDLGANLMEKARADARRALILTVISGVIGGLIVLAISPIALRVADVSDVARGYLKTMLVINSFYIMGTAVNSTFISGLFRAGGDSRFGMVCDIINMWCYALPLGFIAAFVLKLPPMVVYVLLCTDEFVKWPWVIKRYRTERWLNNLTSV